MNEALYAMYSYIPTCFMLRRQLCVFRLGSSLAAPSLPFRCRFAFVTEASNFKDFHAMFMEQKQLN